MLQKTWAGCDGRAWGGRGWKPLASFGLKCVGVRVWAFRGDLSPGEGVNVCRAPPSPSRIARRPPKARVKLC
jgi:hypothetical protein